MERPRQLHVIFGAGQIGTPLAEQLARRGHEVRVVRRSPGLAPAGATLRTGDAGDVAFVDEATRGAAVLYHCMNPEYSAAAWSRELPRWRQALLAAAARSGARVVLLDNVYLLGRPRGSKLSENSPISPSSKKGEIRAQEWHAWIAAHHKGDARVVCGRASDFYGPGATQSYFGDTFMPPITTRSMWRRDWPSWARPPRARSAAGGCCRQRPPSPRRRCSIAWETPWA
ncbi:MAG: NAD-dependent epimerase/dehydratase family protein [Deltaproteobacteria bacterium]|nr:MAG: NAD-dependent epimerase/dehydratase family protein [Deltaproteobacteria bacterium]